MALKNTIKFVFVRLWIAHGINVASETPEQT
jgi:hypothetical protein